MKFVQSILIAVIILSVASCDNTKHLAANQNLFIGSTSKVKSTTKISKGEKDDIAEQMQALVRPKPNTTLLGARYKLAIYNSVSEPKKKKGLKFWWKYKVGEPPVFASYTALEKNRQIMQNHLDNKGYFRDSVMIDTTIKHKKLSVTYTALVDSQYKVKTVAYPNDSSELAKQIQATAINKNEVLIKPKDPYDLDVIKAEDTRLDANLKENGYYYFAPNYLTTDIDSTTGNHTVGMNFRIKPETPTLARKPYYIKDVYVFTDFDINGDTSLIGAQNYDGYTIIDPDKKFRPIVFSRTLVFQSGDVYNRSDHNLSLNRLITLGVYKFVKVRFEPGDSAQTLNAFYYLTPTNKKSLRFQVSALQKSNSATGTQLTINWRNRNLLKGAELLTIAANGGVEKQISSGLSSNILTAGIEADLYVPRIISPFEFNTSSAFVPQTKFSLGYQLYNSSSEYTLKSINASAGYVWKNSIQTEQTLTPININYVKPGKITDAYQAKIDSDITLARRIEKQFIIGSIYNYNYSSLAKPNNNRNNFYFNGNIDLSGNIYGLISGADVKNGKERKIFGTPFTQYIRLETDFRDYLNLGTPTRSLNARLYAGEGYAYGNSLTMPYIKAFFAGGVSDLRGFRARTLGPGSYYAGNAKDSFVADQPGDIKLLGTLEYRAKLFSIIRYALFTDAGNVWTRRDDPHRPGSKFSGDFLSQLAVDAGIGFRVDISILVLRLDIAFPLSIPYALPNGEKYKVDFGNSQWRSNYLVYNLAIGYPF